MGGSLLSQARWGTAAAGRIIENRCERCSRNAGPELVEGYRRRWMVEGISERRVKFFENLAREISFHY